MSSRDKFQKPKPTDFYKGVVSSGYVEERKNRKTWRMEDKIIQEYLNNLSDIKNVLDVPFGTGRFVPYYLKKNLDVYGLEISPSMIEEAKKNLGDDFLKCNTIVGNSIQIPFEDNKFDLIVCVRFLTAIITFDEVLLSLKEFSRTTRKYFLLEIGVRDINDPRPRLPNGDEKMAFWFYPNEIRQLLLDNKIQVINSKPVIKDLHLFFCEKI